MNGLPASSDTLSSLKSGTGRFGAATCGAARSCSLFRGVQCSMSWWLMKFTTTDLYKGASTMVFESCYEQASPIIVLTWRPRLLRPGQKAWSVTPTWHTSQITCAAGMMGCWLHHPSRLYHFQGHITATWVWVGAEICHRLLPGESLRNIRRQHSVW